MTRKAVSVYMTATCAMSIVVPGRFAIALILSLELLFINLLGTLFSSLLDILKIKQLRITSMCAFAVMMTILIKQILILFMPETAMQLSFILYLPAISAFSTAFLFDERKLSLKEALLNNLSPVIVFSVYMLVISLLRDILGYGTITFLAPKKMLEIIILPENKVFAGSFIATIPGALVLSSVFLAVFLAIEDRANTISKAGIQK